MTLSVKHTLTFSILLWHPLGKSTHSATPAIDPDSLLQRENRIEQIEVKKRLDKTADIV
jgi:hypothetical protein